jgi:hypothetical protein
VVKVGGVKAWRQYSRCRAGRWKWSKVAGFGGGAAELDDVK